MHALDDRLGCLGGNVEARIMADEGHGGVVTLIQRFGSVANLNMHPHDLPLDAVYQCGADGVPEFVESGLAHRRRGACAAAGDHHPPDEDAHAHGTCWSRTWGRPLAEPDADGEEARPQRPLQAAAVTYRIAFGPRAGQKVLTLKARCHARAQCASSCAPT
jgi:hypothetical protein